MRVPMSGSNPIPARRRCAPSPKRSRRARGRSCSWAAVRGMPRRRPRSRPLRARTSCRCAAASAARTASTIEHPCYAGDVGLGVNPKLAARIKDSDLLIVVGARLGEATSGGYTLIDIPVPQQRLVHVHPDPEELGRVYEPFLAINAAPRSFAAALAIARAGERAALGGDGGSGASRVSGMAGAGGVAGRAADERHRALAQRPFAGRRDHLQRRRQFLHLGSSLLPLPALRHAACADQRLDGLWLSGGGGGEARASRAHRGVLCRRRRFPDDRAGTGDGDAARARAHRAAS